MSEDNNQKKAPKKAPKNKTKSKPTLKQSNAARLKSFDSVASSIESEPFRKIFRHPCMKAGDACAVVGVLNHRETFNGYKDEDAAALAIKELNKQYFK